MPDLVSRRTVLASESRKLFAFNGVVSDFGALN
jgi:hypothetical protein